MIVVAVLGACGGGGGSSTPATVHITYKTAGQASAPKVSYRTATGTQEVRITTNSQGGIDQAYEVDVPKGSPVSMTIEITVPGDDNVRCTIVGSTGQTIADNASSGTTGTKATCEGVAA